MAVEGDVCGIESTSRTYGGHAVTAQAQADHFGGALGALPPVKFAGGKADASRAFAGQLHVAAGKAAAAYDRVASYLPRVATAVEHSQQAEQALNRAKADTAHAVADVATATAALAKAEAVVAAKKAAAAIASALGGVVGAATAAAAGPTPGELAAVTAAQHRLTTAQHALERAKAAETRAQHRFQDAEHQRMSVLDGFRALCQEEAAALGGSIPTPPPGDSAFASTLMNPMLLLQDSQMSTLRGEAKTLQDMPRILAIIQRNNPRADLRGVQAALLTMQYRQLEAIIPLPPPPAKKKEHHSLISLHTFEKVGGTALHFTGRAVVGAKDGLVGVATTSYGLVKMAALANNVFDPAAAQRYRDQLSERANEFYAKVWHDPIGTAGDLVGVHDLIHDPGHWFGNAGFAAATAFATDGVSAELKVTESTDKALRAARDIHVDRVLRGTSPKHLARAIEAQKEIVALGPRLKGLRAADTALETYGKAGSATAVPGYLHDQLDPAGSCKPYNGDGLLPGPAAGKVGSHLHGRIR